MTLHITTQAIHAACASLIHSVDPQSHIYDNPTQQKAVFPAWWVLNRDNSMEHEPCGRVWVTHGIELVYVYAKDSNDTRLYDKYFEMADKLSQVCDIITITEGTVSESIHTIQQSWSIERDALHFTFQVKIRASAEHTAIDNMETLTTTVKTKE